ncbi:MAG: hypothetical protein WB580_00355 [Candidatus Binataceae bacterium]
MKRIIELIKWLFGPEPPPGAPPRKEPYVCGWQRAHKSILRRRDIDGMRSKDDALEGKK